MARNVANVRNGNITNQLSDVTGWVQGSVRKIRNQRDVTEQGV